ncbi:MAG TPA: FG-GAP-like repeat-containing protein [Puia sp.]|nr:FG-GAP-like repeat-containing protein [Puia sp.]
MPTSCSTHTRTYAAIWLILLIQLIGFCAHSQMRQVYVDNQQPDNDIKKISFYSPSSGYVAFSKWIGYTTDSGRTFTKKYITIGNVNYNGFYNVNLTFGFGISGVQSFNVDTIIVYGDYGFVPSILYSTDGGDTYTLIYQSQLNAQQYTGGIMDMVFPQNTGTGYAVEADRIIRTTNRGLSWSAVLNDPNAFYTKVIATDNNNVFAFSSAKLMKSANGGNTWQQVTIPGKQLNAAHFLTPSKAWVAMRDDFGLYYSADGGLSWKLKNNTTVNPLYSDEISFINDSVGYATSGYEVLKTSDSGRSWQPLPRDNNYSHLNFGLTDLFFIDQHQFWAGGGQGFLEITGNGGGTPIAKAYFDIDTTGSWQTYAITLTNFSQKGYQYKWFLNGSLLSSNYNTSYTHDFHRQADSIKLIVTDGITSDTMLRIQYFSVPDLPVITSFYPPTGSKGTEVILTGTGFSGVTAVSFGNTPAQSFKINSATQLTAYVDNGATGSVSVTDMHGTYSLPGFTYYAPPLSGPPVIDAISPASGPVGTAVILSGSNFDALPSNNIVYFGATRATVQSASATQLNCMVPIGASYEPISVLNTRTGLIGQSLKPFATTFDDTSNFTPGSFVQGASLALPNNYIYTKYMIGKDLDGDGKVDVLGLSQAYGGSDSILAFRNTTVAGAAMSFSSYKKVGAVPTNGPGKFDLGDLDGDGLSDLAAVTNAQYLVFYKNLSTPGNIQFGNIIGLACSGSSYDIHITDLDGDGKNDLVVGTFGGVNGLVVFRNTSSPGALSFAGQQTYRSVNGNSMAVAVGDLDGDGKKDVITSDFGSSTSSFTCFRNTSTPGNISLVPANTVSVAGSNLEASSILLVDVDNDGRLDVVATTSAEYCTVYRNTSTPGNFSFAAPYNYPVGNGIGSGLMMADLNGDNRPDYFGSGLSGLAFTIMRNISTPGAIAFDGATNYGTVAPYYVNSGDFDGDGKTDIIISNTPRGSGFTIYKNNIDPVIISSVCENAEDDILSNITGTSYQWQQDDGNGFANIADDAVFSGATTQKLIIKTAGLSQNGYIYRCLVDGVSYSSKFRLQVNGIVHPHVDMHASDTVICSSVSVTFTASSTNVLSPYYVWQIDGQPQSDHDSIFTSDNLKNGDLVNVIVTSTYNCALIRSDTSASLKMTVHTVHTVPITIQASSTSICAGTDVTFTAQGIDTIANPSLQWQLNGMTASENTGTFSSSSLSDKDQVKLILTDNAACIAASTSNSITMTVNKWSTPAVTINGSIDPVCPGVPVTFMATATDIGSTTSYQWMKNGKPVGTNNEIYIDSSLADGDMISTTIVTNPVCPTTTTAQSNSLPVAVVKITRPRITISGSSTADAGQTILLSSVVSDAGSAPVYHWQDSTASNDWHDISSASMDTLRYSPARSGDKIRCIFTGTDTTCTNITLSDTSNVISFVVTDVASPPNSGTTIHLFPNPVHSILYIDSLKATDHWQTLDIISLSGSVKLRTANIEGQADLTVHVEAIPAGMYVVVLRNKSGNTWHFKFLKL